MHEFTDEQRAFLQASGNIVLHACPGSGKTSVVAQKLIQYITEWFRPHQGVAVLSFTNVASEEVEKQTRKIMPDGFMIDYPHYVGTLDSFINQFILLRFGYLLFESSQRPTIAFNDLYSLPFRFWRTECHRNGCVDGISDFRWDMDGNLLRNKEAVTCSGGTYGPPCYQYKTMLLKKGLVFQSEVSSLAYWLLRDYPQIAQSLAARFPIIILDEAQDTSIEQMAIIDLINQAGAESIFLVGDPDQSIYEWRNATPECFTNKMSCSDWTTLSLTANFRSSQLICNATHLFAKSLEQQTPSIAQGLCSDFEQKPILLLYSGSIGERKNELISKFINLCESNSIGIGSSNIAVVTRSRVYSDTDIAGLWKSKEVEFLSLASYEWYLGSRKKAYDACEKALFSLLIKGYKDIEISIESEVEKMMSYQTWRSIVIEVLISLPEANQTIENWILQAKKGLSEVFANFGLQTRTDLTIADIVKIKTRDKKVPHFKSIPLKHFFEGKSKGQYTLSSIHGVKGETYDALMLIVESSKGKTLTPTFLNEGNIDHELMRIAYVAMTRPKKLLVVAMPDVKSRNVHPRFPEDKWEYLRF